MFLEATGAELFYITVFIGAVLITIILELGLRILKGLLRIIFVLEDKEA